MTRTESAEKRLAELSTMTQEQLAALCASQECVTDVTTLNEKNLILHIMGGEGYDVEIFDGDVVIVEYEDDEPVVTDTAPAVNPALPEITTTINPAPAETKSPAKPAPKPKLWVDEKALADPKLCPLIVDGKACGAEKLAKHDLCSACHKAHGWYGRKKVAEAKDRVANRIPTERFDSIVDTAQPLVRHDDGDEDLAALARVIAKKPADRPETSWPDFSDVAMSVIMAAARKARYNVAKKAEVNGERWQWTLDQIRSIQPEGPLDPGGFKLTHKTGPITPAMIQRACQVIWSGDEGLRIEPRWKEWAKGAGELCRQEVCKTWPEEDDPTGRSIETDFFSEDEIRRRGLAYQGKLVTPRMMEIACKNERWRRKEAAKLAQEKKFLERAKTAKTGGNGNGQKRRDNGGRDRSYKGKGGSHYSPPLKNGIRGLENLPN
ncbi:hypothetical protein A2468_00510 [Candidatus Falkowbacteria bacterium RIFOXYC2_FULL_46_15]|nr:MAG: hypothetical protein A2468_00510 [Candidatus Falkowbacteria bacterium RIFOXYC2_FULL_46_15]